MDQAIDGPGKCDKKDETKQRHAIEPQLQAPDLFVAGGDGFLKKHHMISIALTKEVKTKGRIRVRYEKWEAIATMRPAEETKNNNQYKPVFFFSCSIVENLCESTTNPLSIQSEKNEYLRAADKQDLA